MSKDIDTLTSDWRISVLQKASYADLSETKSYLRKKREFLGFKVLKL
jgi:hypothetical protein